MFENRNASARTVLGSCTDVPQSRTPGHPAHPPSARPFRTGRAGRRRGAAVRRRPDVRGLQALGGPAGAPVGADRGDGRRPRRAHAGAPSARWSATTSSTTSTSSTSRPTCPTRSTSGCGACVEALADDAVPRRTLAQLGTGVVDLLTLPSYGNYRHTYAEMLAAHDELIAAAGDRMTVLHLGGTLDDEVTRPVPGPGRQHHPLGE